MHYRPHVTDCHGRPRANASTPAHWSRADHSPDEQHGPTLPGYESAPIDGSLDPSEFVEALVRPDPNGLGRGDAVPLGKFQKTGDFDIVDSRVADGTTTLTYRDPSSVFAPYERIRSEAMLSAAIVFIHDELGFRRRARMLADPRWFRLELERAGQTE